MFRIIIAALFVLHGLIHFFGFAKAFTLADIPQLLQPISQPVGLLWLVAGVLCVVAAGGLFFAPRWWWAVGAVAVVTSQGVIFSSWRDASVGTVANVVLLGAVVYGFASRGPLSLRSEFEHDLARVWPPVPSASGKAIVEADLTSLPDPVQRYLRRSGVVGLPPVTDFRATWTGRMRSAPDSAWMTFTADQLDLVNTPERFFMMNAKMKGLPVDVLHAFDDDGATMRVRLLSMRSMVDAKGAALTRAETVTMFNDLCCLAPGALLSPDITWEPIDTHTATAHFTLGANTITAELRFDDLGDLIDFVADGRGGMSPDGRTLTPMRWSTPLRDYAQVGPARVATKAEVKWHPDSGAWTYGEFELTSLAYNVANRRPSATLLMTLSGRLWLRLSLVAGVLAVIGSAIGLTVPGIYRALTPAFLPQALAQDLANLVVVGPVLLFCSFLALRGSLRGRVIWLGAVTFTVYNYVIYAFSIPFGPLLPVWIAVLGMCLFALIGGVATTDSRSAAARFGSPRALVVTGWSLLVVGTLFTLLWLSEDIPAWLSGSTPQSAIDMAVPTNPVHILDLAFFLPAVAVVGVLLLRGRAFAYPLAPALVVFLILTGVPILITPFVQLVIGQAPGWAVCVPIGVLTLYLLGLLVWLLWTITPGVRPAADTPTRANRPSVNSNSPRWPTTWQAESSQPAKNLTRE